MNYYLSSDELLNYTENQNGTKKAKVMLDFRFLFCGIGALTYKETVDDTQILTE